MVGLTVDKLWHRLASMPGLKSASMTCVLQHEAASSQDRVRLNALVQHLSALLVEQTGMLVLSHFTGRTHQADLIIEHWSSELHTLWRIDGKNCIRSPPKLSFEHFPEQVDGVWAKFFSCNCHRNIQFCRACWKPDHISDVNRADKLRFAYEGNIDASTCLGGPHPAQE